MRLGTAFAIGLAALLIMGARHAADVNRPAHISPRSLSDTGGLVRMVVAADGNEARYRVREQLAGVDFPNDAIGHTDAVSGAIVLDDSGHVVTADSKIVVNVTGLRSDRDRRDRYVQRRILETEQYPTVTLVPTEMRGLPWPIPPSATFDFALEGLLTVHGVTKPTIWEASGRSDNGIVSGTATTTFTFDDFGLDKPRVAVVLSVEDTIQLEYEFRFVPDTTAS